MIDYFRLRCIPGWRGFACVLDNLTGVHREPRGGLLGLTCLVHEWASASYWKGDE